MPIEGARRTPSPEATELTAEKPHSNAHFIGMVRFEGYATGNMAEPENRLSRVEKHLDLTDPSLPERVLDPPLDHCRLFGQIDGDRMAGRAAPVSTVLSPAFGDSARQHLVSARPK
jgi:hypothetical protein